MKKPFQVGDRVRVFDAESINGAARVYTIDGSIEAIAKDGTLHLDGKDGNGPFVAHPKQCRRLVRKERRRVWVTKDARDDPKVQQWAGFDENVNYGQAEYVQYRKPK